MRRASQWTDWVLNTGLLLVQMGVLNKLKYIDQYESKVLQNETSQLSNKLSCKYAQFQGFVGPINSQDGLLNSFSFHCNIVFFSISPVYCKRGAW